MMRYRRRFLNPIPAVFLFCGLLSAQGQELIEAKIRAVSVTQKSEQTRSEFELSADWTAVWRNPTAELRPLQIVHGVPVQQANSTGMTALKNLGLGGIVCNVDFSEYMVSEANWETLVRTIEACRKTGLIVWIYDEEGYPSGAAGGLVLKDNPDYEAIALTHDPSRPEPLALRPAYENTHASNNYHAARRYPNLLDEQAVQCFIKVTHEAYWRLLKGHFGTTVKAFFTDEPSLMAVNIGPLPDDIKTNVRVVDPLDADVKPLPSVPWVRDIPARYRERYGENIMEVRRSLFEGTDEADRRVRQQFWGLISDLVSKRYFGQIRQWAKAHGVASSGHSLWEETPLHHIPLEGDALKALGQMDMPGLDMLSSEPQAVIYGGWLTASLPASAALFNGGRRVMTEVSDFSQTMAGKGQAPLTDMMATAGWQAAFGVTEFTLYYDYRQRKNGTYKQYCDFVGRLNAFLREAQPVPRVLLYYPIYDLWGEYIPVAEKLTLDSQSKRMQQIINSFMKLGRRMVKEQISFAVVNHELLASAKVHDKDIWIAGQRFEALVMPAAVELPMSGAAVVEQFKANGGKVLPDKISGKAIDFDSLDSVYASGRLTVPYDQIIVGRFSRQSRDILILVNVAAEPYSGRISGKNSAQWFVAHPDSGQIERIKTDESGRIAVSIPSRGVILLIGYPQTEM
ncbi:MAG: hypothetical protein RQ760_08795 [Sedimentisphaerales bacterium]|nr:hypothetical protein [Sedimentisphaerales bacterium]